MLVLTRRIGECVVIGDDITLAIQRIAGSRVAIGIEAPREVKVVRGELLSTEYEDAEAGSPISPGAASSR